MVILNLQDKKVIVIHKIVKLTINDFMIIVEGLVGIVKQ